MKKVIAETLLAAVVAASIFGTAACNKPGAGTAKPNPNESQSAQQTADQKPNETHNASVPAAEKTYTLKIAADDAAQTETVYTVTYKDNALYGEQNTTVGDPAKLDGPSPLPHGEFTVTQQELVEPLLPLLEKSEDNYSVTNTLSLIFDMFERGLEKNDDLSKEYGSWFYDSSAFFADLNQDGKITMHEYYCYLVMSEDPSFKPNIEIKEKDANTLEWEAKRIIPRSDSTVAPRFDLLDPNGKLITLNGKAYDLTNLTLKQLLDDGLVGEFSFEKRSQTARKCYFPDCPDVWMIVEYTLRDADAEHTAENYYVIGLDILLAFGTKDSYFYKVGNLVIDEKAEKQTVYDYFGLEMNGNATAYLHYEDTKAIKLQLGAIYGSSEYANILKISITKRTS